MVSITGTVTNNTDVATKAFVLANAGSSITPAKQVTLNTAGNLQTLTSPAPTPGDISGQGNFIMKGGAFSAFDSSSTALQIRPTADGFVSYAGLGCMELYGPGLLTGPRPVSLLIETTSITPTANLTEALHEFYY